MTHEGLPLTFKDENRALQELAREWSVLRQHNLKFKEGDPQQTLLMARRAWKGPRGSKDRSRRSSRNALLRPLQQR